MRRLRPLGLLTALAVGALATLAAACGGTEEPNEVAIEGHEFAFEVDGSAFTPGTNTITFKNTGAQTHDLQMIQIGDHTIDDVAAVAQGLEQGQPPPEWFVFSGGVGEVAPGESGSITGSFAAGNYALVCFVPDIADGVPHFAKGMAALITIEGDVNGAEIPEQDFTLRARDDGAGTSHSFSLRARVRPASGNLRVESGRVRLLLDNDGSEPHEANLLKFDEGFTFDQFVELLAAAGEGPPSGPPPFTEVGGVQAILPGTSQMATFNLEPGDYALICLLPNAQGIPHFALGMVLEMEVQEGRGGTGN